MNGVAIVGTGLAGLVQAIALAEAGIAVTLLGPLPVTEQDDRTTAILNPGIDFLQSLGLWDTISPTATALVTMELVDGISPFLYDASEIDAAQLGYNIGNAVLKETLVRLLNGHTLVKWHKTLVENMDAQLDGWRITLKNGEELDASLVIGADGRHGLVRKAAGITLREKDVDQHALVTVLQSEKPHYNVTLEIFRRGGPLTLVPTGKNKFALVWCDDSALLQDRMSASTDELGEELSLLTDHRFGRLTVIGDRQLWPVQPMHATALVAKNCVLIGEAAHTLPPIGAQGFNTTLQDIIALTTILRENVRLGLKLNDGGQLQRYQARRLPDILLRYRSVNALNSLLRSGNPFVHSLRRLALGGVDRIGFLKQYLMFIGLRPRT